MRNDLITKINNLCDEVTDLRARNSYLESQIKKEIMCVDTAKSSLEMKTDIDRKLLDYAKKELFEKVLRGYSKLEVKEKDGKFIFTTFEEWSERKIYNDYIPSAFSKEDIKNILYNELFEKYESEKAEAIKEYEKNKMKECEEE